MNTATINDITYLVLLLSLLFLILFLVHVTVYLCVYKKQAFSPILRIITFSFALLFVTFTVSFLYLSRTPAFLVSEKERKTQLLTQRINNGDDDHMLDAIYALYPSNHSDDNDTINRFLLLQLYYEKTNSFEMEIGTLHEFSLRTEILEQDSHLYFLIQKRLEQLKPKATGKIQPIYEKTLENLEAISPE